MADSLTITVDTAALFAAMDTCVPEMERTLLEAARVTAENIAREAAARVTRRTGKTAEGITVAQARRGDGYVVFVRRPEQPGLPTWLEFGTVRMTAKPFLFASARLEEGAHDRRAREAVQAAINAVGLGD